MAMNTLDNPFFVDVKEGAIAEAEERGIELVTSNAHGDPGRQLADVETLLLKDLDILIINPVDSDAVVAAVEKANAAGMPVFTIDRMALGGEVLTHIGFDALRSGNLAGDFLAQALDGRGKIVEIQGILGTNVARERSRGFNQAMDRNPDMEVIARHTANFDRGEALSVMESILLAHPEIDGVYAANDEMAMGALAAIEAAGRLDEIVLIGCDAIEPAMDAIRQGKLEATIAEPPFFLGREGIKIAEKIYNGESIEELILLENKLVTIDNVDQIKTR